MILCSHFGPAYFLAAADGEGIVTTARSLGKLVFTYKSSIKPPMLI